MGELDGEIDEDDRCDIVVLRRNEGDSGGVRVLDVCEVLGS
jgi:hypothetical protein